MLKNCLSKLHSSCYFMIADYIYMYIYIENYIYIYIYIHTQGFSHWGNRGRVPPPPTNLNFAHRPNLENFPPKILLPLPPNIYSPATIMQQFSSYNPIKRAFLAVVIAIAPFLF